MRAEEQSLADIASWYFGLAHRFPDVFDEHDLNMYWNWTSKKSEPIARDYFVSSLRAGALKTLRRSVGSCKACPLHVNRLPGRPVLDDCSYTNDPFTEYGDTRMPVGATSAKIMVIAEGPGQFEQRTGTPFVTYQILVGSMCGWECDNFELCYNDKSREPQKVCSPVSMRKKLEGTGASLITVEEMLQKTRFTRANAPSFPILTVASILDNALLATGLWREGWNPRQSVRESSATAPKPGSIYLTNMVKCRSCVPLGNGRMKDEHPTKEDMDTCTKWLEMQIYIVQPLVIVALGNTAVSGTTDIIDPKILSMKGNVYPGKFGLPVLVDTHPSYIHRQEEKIQKELTENLSATFEKAKAIANGTFELPWMVKSEDIVDDFPTPDEMEFTNTFGD